jgi:hypothetical protein
MFVAILTGLIGVIVLAQALFGKDSSELQETHPADGDAPRGAL